jgi:hypothetical protein
MIEIPLLGQVEKDRFDDWLRSKPIPLPVLGGNEYEFLLEGYKEDDNKEDFHEAIRNFISLDESALKISQDSVFQYYEDMLHHMPGDDWHVEIKTSEEVWKHIQFGMPIVSRRSHGDKEVYISLECSCDWEREHGLQIVFKKGLYVNKIGPFDGHLTNSDAFADESLEDVVYKSA